MGLQAMPDFEGEKMYREVRFTVEAREDNSILGFAIGGLPDDLHSWFTTRVIKIGNGDREVAISRLELDQLIESAQTWLKVNGEDRNFIDALALEKTLISLSEFSSMPNSYVITFSNCEGVEVDE